MGNGCLKSTKSTKTQNGNIFNPIAKLVSYKKKRRSTVASLNSIDEFQQKLSINLLTKRDKELIERCWRHQIFSVRRDIFHRTMLLCIEASPKISEVIACAKYCYKDLTKWPKLNRICQAQFVFFEKLIYLYNLEEKSMFEPCWRLGEMHANYSQFELKPHFLDIYQQQFLSQLARMEMQDKVETCIAFTHLIGFVVEIMNQGYTQKCLEFRNVMTPRREMIMFI